MDKDLYREPIAWKFLVDQVTSGYCNKSMGQCFLVNPSIPDHILQKVKLENNILEIGPGLGILSYSILKLAAPGTKLTLVEKDARFIPHLEKLLYPLASKKNINLKILFEDALTYDVEEPVQIISNIPYNLSSQLLFKWIKNNKFYPNIVVMLQKEVADKVRKPIEVNEDYSMLSILYQCSGDVKKIMDLSAQSFLPAPKVDSQVIHYEGCGIDNKILSKLILILNQAFSNPRKMIGKNVEDPILRKILSTYSMQKYRPGALTPQQYLQIAKEFYAVSK